MLSVEQLPRCRAGDGAGLIRKRKAMLVVSQLRAAVAVYHTELTATQHTVELITQHWQKHAAVHSRRLPVDVEEVGELALPTAAQHVPPIAVARIGDAQVIWDDVEELSHTVPSQLCVETRESRVSTQLLAHMLGIDHVVAVGAPRGCLHVRGAVQMGDAELRQVRHDCLRGGEVELPPKLNTVGGERLRPHRRSASAAAMRRGS